MQANYIDFTMSAMDGGTTITIKEMSVGEYTRMLKDIPDDSEATQGELFAMHALVAVNGQPTGEGAKREKAFHELGVRGGEFFVSAFRSVHNTTEDDTIAFLATRRPSKFRGA